MNPDKEARLKLLRQEISVLEQELEKEARAQTDAFVKKAQELSMFNTERGMHHGYVETYIQDDRYEQGAELGIVVYDETMGGDEVSVQIFGMAEDERSDEVQFWISIDTFLNFRVDEWKMLVKFLNDQNRMLDEQQKIQAEAERRKGFIIKETLKQAKTFVATGGSIYGEGTRVTSDPCVYDPHRECYWTGRSWKPAISEAYAYSNVNNAMRCSGARQCQTVGDFYEIRRRVIIDRLNKDGTHSFHFVDGGVWDSD